MFQEEEKCAVCPDECPVQGCLFFPDPRSHHLLGYDTQGTDLATSPSHWMREDDCSVYRVKESEVVPFLYHPYGAAALDHLIAHELH